MKVKYGHGYCDNTECENSRKRQNLLVVILIKDFDYEVCLWCKKCIRRDRKMVQETKEI